MVIKVLSQNVYRIMNKFIKTLTVYHKLQLILYYRIM